MGNALTASFVMLATSAGARGSFERRGLGYAPPTEQDWVYIGSGLLLAVVLMVAIWRHIDHK